MTVTHRSLTTASANTSIVNPTVKLTLTKPISSPAKVEESSLLVNVLGLVLWFSGFVGALAFVAFAHWTKTR